MRSIADWACQCWPSLAGNVCEMASFQFFPANAMLSVPETCRTPLSVSRYAILARPECASASRDALATRSTIAAVSTAEPEGAAPPPPVAVVATSAVAAAAASAAVTPVTRSVSDRLARRRRLASRSAGGWMVATSRRSRVRRWSASWSSVSMKHLRCAAGTRGNVVEGDAKAGQGTGGIGLHGPLRDAEQLGGICHRQILKEPQHHDMALARRQLYQGLDDAVPLADLVGQSIDHSRRPCGFSKRALSRAAPQPAHPVPAKVH